MMEWKKLFIPYRRIPFSYAWLVVGQAVLALLFWWLHPGRDIPSLGEVLRSWNSLALTQGMLPELYTSVVTSWEAIILSGVISIGIALASTAVFFRPSATLIASFRFLGFMGLTYLFTLWTSGATELKVFLLTFGMSVFLVTNLLSEVGEIPRDNIDYAKTMRLYGWRITWEIAFRGKIDVMLDLIRQNAAMGWTLLTLVEGLTRSEGGIGTLLVNQNRHFDLAAIFAIQCTILLYGITQDFLLARLRLLLCPYVKLAGDR